MSSISIVMTYFNRKPQLEITLSTICKSSVRDELEIIIVDDGSSEEHILDEDWAKKWPLVIRIWRIRPDQKSWVNPVIPFNFGLTKARGEWIIIQNPEVCHVGDVCGFVKGAKRKFYHVLEVYALPKEASEMLPEALTNPLELIEESSKYSVKGRPSCMWYTRTKTGKPYYLHFCSALHRSKLNLVGGFNSKMAHGSSFDDNEFLTRVQRIAKPKFMPRPLMGFHIWHDKLLTSIATPETIQKNKVIFERTKAKKKVIHTKRINPLADLLYLPSVGMDVPKVFVFGSNGMLGRSICAFLKSKKVKVVPLTRKDFDIETLDYGSLLRLGKTYEWSRENWVVNAAGVIPQTTSFENPHRFVKVNAVFPHLLAAACAVFGSRLFHITTDCVYSGETGPYLEGTSHDEMSIYGVSKSCGEPLGDNAMILRTSIIGEEGETAPKASLLEWVRTKAPSTFEGFTNHIWNGITCIEVARIFYDAITKDKTWRGIRVPQSEVVSKFELVSLINEVYGLGKTIEPVKAKPKSKVLLAEKEKGVEVQSLKHQVIFQRDFWLSNTK